MRVMKLLKGEMFRTEIFAILEIKHGKVQKTWNLTCLNLCYIFFFLHIEKPNLF